MHDAKEMGIVLQWHNTYSDSYDSCCNLVYLLLTNDDDVALDWVLFAGCL